MHRRKLSVTLPIWLTLAMLGFTLPASAQIVAPADTEISEETENFTPDYEPPPVPGQTPTPRRRPSATYPGNPNQATQVPITGPAPLPEDLLNPTEELAPNRPPQQFPIPWWVWVAGGFGVWILIALILLLFMRKRKEAQIIRLTPIERFQQNLQRAKQYAQDGRDHPFALTLSEAVRGYVEGEWSIPALEQTLDELAADPALIESLDDDSRSQLLSILQRLEPALYAGQTLGRLRMEELTTEAVEWVKAARARKPEPEEAASVPETETAASNP